MYISYYTHILFAKAKDFFSTAFLPVGICTFGQTMVQGQELTTECGYKGLISDERPNDGSKGAKRSFKSQFLVPLPKCRPSLWEQSPLAFRVPNYKGRKWRKKRDVLE